MQQKLCFNRNPVAIVNATGPTFFTRTTNAREGMFLEFRGLFSSNERFRRTDAYTANAFVAWQANIKEPTLPA